MPGPTAVRAVLLALLLGAGATVVLTPPTPALGSPTPDPGAGDGFRGETITVVTTQGRGSGGWLVAVNGSGAERYRFGNYTSFHDVDPSPAGRWTVTVVAAKLRHDGPCDAPRCARNDVLRVNLTTGERTVLYSAWLPGWHKWHDADRINATHFLVADVAGDRVVALDVSAYEPGAGPRPYGADVTWEWDAATAYPPPAESGGPPADWTHVNDVEVLADGRFMVSLRNLDQVVFLRPGEGRQEEWTLGADGAYGFLYEQHNPDYLSPACGGPAVVVADSEKNQVAEFSREGGRWRRVWAWSTPWLQWPRDADRLPNGHTLVTDTNGDRILEVNESGGVVWTYDIDRPYEAERLGTGDESAGGPARTGNGSTATCAGAGSDASGTSEDGAALDRAPATRPLAAAAKILLPPKLLSGVLFWAPVWITVGDVLVLLVGGLAGVGLAAHEVVRRRERAPRT